MSIEKTLLMNQLFSIYHKLLTQKQEEMLSLYYEEDYSLSEIAEHYDISRQGVRDNIRRGEEALLTYEDKLKLSQQRQRRLMKFKELEKLNQNPELAIVIHDLIDLEYE